MVQLACLEGKEFHSILLLVCLYVAKIFHKAPPHVPLPMQFLPPLGSQLLGLLSFRALSLQFRSLRMNYSERSYGLV